jgi:hypothetical protein
MTLREGDRIRNLLLQKDYRLKWIGDRMVVMESEDRSSQILTTKDSLTLFYEKVERKLKDHSPWLCNL